MMRMRIPGAGLGGARPTCLVPRPRLTLGRRRTSLLSAGHIEVKENEGIVFVNNIFPQRLQWLLRGGPFSGSQSYDETLKRIDKPHIAAAEPSGIIKRVFPQGLPLEIKEIIPRFHEGGAFVKYAHKADVRDMDVVAAVKEHLEKHPIKPWFNPLQKVEVARVLGKPWIEDLYRIPSQRLLVEFLPTSPETAPVELGQESLYSLFRPYGKLTDIQKQPSDSKVVPRYAYLEFSRAKYAVMAKNCMHGFVLPEAEGGGKAGTRLRLKYERRIKFTIIKDWLLSHPRIIIPALAALIAAITVIVFDPIRTFFIKMKLKASAHTEENSVLQWIRRQISKANIRYFGHGHHELSDARGLMAIWEDRQRDIAQLQGWLTENVGTFIVVHGPRGSGKRELVLDQALKTRKYKVVIDCKQIQDARGDTSKIARVAAQVGYRPVFSWMNSISSFVDLASQGIIGTKAGFSETLDAQLSKIWQNTATALKQVALESKKADEKDDHLSDEEYLEGHPESRPVVVIDNFLHNAGEGSVVYDKITEWAAGLTTSNIAHVIFITTDASFSKPLSKALPNQVFRTIPLGDCAPEVGRKYVLSYLEHESANDENPSKLPDQSDDLDKCIALLGGRVTDLEAMAHRMKIGESPQGAVNRIIEQSVSEILKMYILDTASAAADGQWTREQVWHLIKTLGSAESGTIPYSKILLSGLFKENGESTLRALEQTELISIASQNGCPQTVKPGRPIYRTVFRRLTENKALAGRLDLAILGQLIDKENKSIAQYEQELQVLGSLPKQPSELWSRVQWLLHKVQGSQNKIAKLERESSALQKILESEH